MIHVFLQTDGNFIKKHGEILLVTRAASSPKVLTSQEKQKFGGKVFPHSRHTFAHKMGAYGDTPYLHLPANTHPNIVEPESF